MGKPAARVGDGHVCPMVTPGTGTPHTGGPILGPGCGSVLIEGQPAATAGDVCGCTGAVDKITNGSTGVFIGGKPAARTGDKCEHGGVVIGGSGMVLIGESMGRNFLWLPCVWEDDGEHEEPSTDEKIAIVKRVIADCIVLLENKLALLLSNESETVERFEKWFGSFDEERKSVIVKRMEKQIVFFKELGMDKFSRVDYGIGKDVITAFVYPEDGAYTIYLGNEFWKTRPLDKYSKEGILIHETSHFNHIGRTKDYRYNDKCESLAMDNPKHALYNADSYLWFLNVKWF